VTPKAGENPDPRARTQVGRALAQLDIEHIPAFFTRGPGPLGSAPSAPCRTGCPRSSPSPGSPPLPPPIAICARCSCRPTTHALVAPEQPGSAFVAIGDVDLDQILCLEEPRQLGNDNTVVWRRRRLQIRASPLPPHFVRARVKVRQHLDGTLSISHGPRCIARYGLEGQAHHQQQKWTFHVLCEPDILIRRLHNIINSKVLRGGL
jgi:hypothetical protein